MALIHYQFEAIHPFGDGNGRTGRIINVLYLINKELLQLPILYLSRYVIQNKTDYYRLLKEVTENKNWIDWIHFILEGVGQTAATTLQKIKDILALKQIVEATIEKNLKTSNANQLADLIFSHPYIKVSVLEQNNIAKRQTAANYLKKIEEIGLLHSVKVGKEVYYINHQLMKILSE
jgi:Fic family protein